MILKIASLEFGFADDLLLENVCFQIEERDKIALIGPNGSGKTSLIKLIVGEYEPVKGEIVKKNLLSIGYQTQFRMTDPGRSLWKECETVFHDVKSEIKKSTEITHDMLSFEKKIRSVLKGLGFDEPDWERTLDTFSGGEQTRISLCKLFLRDYDLLILDEPTNHLDLTSVFWLQNYLKNYQGTLLLVSHDRAIVETVANRVYEINAKKIWVFNTCYRDYLLQRERMNDTVKKRKENLVKEIERQEGIIEQFRRWNREKAFKLMHSREKVVERLKGELGQFEEMEETGTDIGSLPLPDRTEWTVISGKNLGKRFENKTVLSNIDFVVNREQKIVLVGRNGIGKTTLLRIIAGEDRDYEGIIEKGSKTRIGYLSQTLQFSDDSLDIFSFLSEIVPDWKDYELRKYAGRFGFVGEDVFKAIRNLSGGEKLKVSLAKIILEKPNFIILDEPTNHLDIESIERLQTILSEYKGSMLVVTHDQWLIEKTFSTVWLLSETGISYPQSTETYLDSLREESVSFRKKKDTEKGKNEEYAMQKILKNRLKSIESKMQEIEGSYEHLEEHTKLIRKEMNLFSHDYQKLEELINKEKRITEEMEALIIKLGELEIEQRKTIAEIGGAV
jgi:ATP-binding cassette subfamily F protein 3